VVEAAEEGGQPLVMDLEQLPAQQPALGAAQQGAHDAQRDGHPDGDGDEGAGAGRELDPALARDAGEQGAGVVEHRDVVRHQVGVAGEQPEAGEDDGPAHRPAQDGAPRFQVAARRRWSERGEAAEQGGEQEVAGGSGHDHREQLADHQPEQGQQASRFG
jgi:hypothetical protein